MTLVERRYGCKLPDPYGWLNGEPKIEPGTVFICDGPEGCDRKWKLIVGDEGGMGWCRTIGSVLRRYERHGRRRRL